MSKCKRTLMMEDAVSEYFMEQYQIALKREQPARKRGLPRTTESADMMGIIEENGEVTDVIVVEIKQSMGDFFTGCGLNFCGVSNYLAVPSELVGFGIIFLRTNDYADVGVLEVTDSYDVRTVLYPTVNTINEYRNVSIIDVQVEPTHVLTRALTCRNSGTTITEEDAAVLKKHYWKRIWSR